MGRALTDSQRVAAKAAFIKALAASGVVLAGCRAAGVDRKSVYQWRKHDEQFGADWAAAIDDATDILEAELMKRARNAEIPGSTTALIFALKACAPHKYRENITISGDRAAPLRLDVARFADDVEARAAATTLRRRLAAGGAIESGGAGDRNGSTLPVPAAHRGD